MLTKLARSFIHPSGLIDKTPEWFFKFRSLLRYGKRAYRVGTKLVGDTASQGQAVSYSNPALHKYLRQATTAKKDDKNKTTKSGGK